MTRFVAGWAALAVILTSANQLRSAAVPVGPGEVLLATWLMFVGFLLLRGQRVVLGPVFRVLVLFWLISSLLLALGALVALNLHKLDWQNSMHHIVALTLQAAFTCLLALRLPGQGNNDYYLVTARAVFFACAVSTTALVALALAAPSIRPIHPW